MLCVHTCLYLVSGQNEIIKLEDRFYYLTMQLNHSQQVLLLCVIIEKNFSVSIVAACDNNDIRLVEGRNDLEGRVELCFQGQWGTVCNTHWDDSDAVVACRQLGLDTECKQQHNISVMRVL